MPISADARMFFSTAAMIARILAQQHGTVLADAMSFILWDIMSGISLLGLSRCPGKVISSDLDVVVGKFTQLVIVHTKQFGFLGGPEMETRDKVDEKGENGRHDEGVGGTGYNIRDLDVELFVFVVGPATGDDAGIDAVQTDNVSCAEEGVGEKAKHAGDTVLGEHVHRIIDTDPILDCG